MAEKTLGQVAYEAYWTTGRLGVEPRWSILHADDKAAWEAGVAAAIQAHEARRWKPIESAPKDRDVDVWDGFERVPNAKYNTQTGTWFSDVFSYGDMDWREMDSQPTHWTPIPAPPQEVE